ncbi:methyltransferase, FxLD system [Antribacter sp. KLBMP9083]|uniref:Protein-L-isoaspartate O-methyltransferase n=1 Tax=Antribacter soli TaxID=2910976 RepID=A0AA41QH19_9MICO|nr:methyltransferase, FxLD system [Antribacter soli]MCF4122067.1 methyltransferase, FxLD system [Antribacter soli]
MSQTTNDLDWAASLREQMVAELESAGLVLTPAVAAALRAVPRHVFGPEEPLEAAYALHTILHRTLDESGAAVSMISAVEVQAMMLEQAQVTSGSRVLEVGSGGYNAALLADMAGPDGQVTTVDIDERVTERTTRYLAQAGYNGVNVVLADADGGVPEHAPYDVIMATTSVQDLPPTWVDQLAPDGRIVVPLRLRGTPRVVVLVRDGDRLVSAGYELGHFVPVRGRSTPDERSLVLDEVGVTLRVDGDVSADQAALASALHTEATVAWATPREVSRFDGLGLWLAVNEDAFGMLNATTDAKDRGLVAHSWAVGIPAILDQVGRSFAYLTLRRTEDGPQFGATGHGENASELVARFVDLIEAWDTTSLDAQISLYPAGTPDDVLPSGEHVRVLDRPRNRVVLTWPTQTPQGV